MDQVFSVILFGYASKTLQLKRLLGCSTGPTSPDMFASYDFSSYQCWGIFSCEKLSVTVLWNLLIHWGLLCGIFRIPLHYILHWIRLKEKQESLLSVAWSCGLLPILSGFTVPPLSLNVRYYILLFLHW